jgi:hypothetical protein
MKHSPRLWYRRHFEVPKAWKGQRVLLHFGAVDWEATVLVNGKEVGTHKGGYDPFTFDITDALTPRGAQELIVGVFDPTNEGTQPRGKQVLEPKGIYYTPTTGIWQTVWLEPVPAASVASLKIVPDLDGRKVIVTVQRRGLLVGHTVELKARAGKEVVARKAGLVGKPIDLPIPKARPWSPDSPFLYDLEVKLVSGGAVVDEVESYFGMRKIEVGKVGGKGPPRILLNGKFLFQVGPLDQGFWPDGLYTAPTDEALKYDIVMTKKLGFNMTRKHVKVEPARWYYWCDRLGLLVWQDMPSGDRSVRKGDPDLKRTPESARQFELELKRMIDGLHNHPSIIAWVVFNEGWGQYDTARLARWTSNYDPTRLVDGASGWNDRKVGHVHDLHDYETAPKGPPVEERRAAVLGEFGGLGLGVDGHTWAKKTWGYQGTASKEDLTRRYERLLSRVWGLKDKGGLCAAVYTQITDVETEANGLLTYDREVLKVDLARVAAVNRGDLSRVPVPRVVVPTSQEKGIPWRYVTGKAPAGWFKEDFKETGWKEGPGGFGTKGTPGAVVRTEWRTANIYIRRTFDLPKVEVKDLYLLLHHDEDAEVYLNGVLAAKVTGYVTDYQEVPISAEAKKALRLGGRNTIAIHCRQTTGGQYIDCGLVELRPRK